MMPLRIIISTFHSKYASVGRPRPRISLVFLLFVLLVLSNITTGCQAKKPLQFARIWGRHYRGGTRTSSVLPSTEASSALDSAEQNNSNDSQTPASSSSSSSTNNNNSTTTAESTTTIPEWKRHLPQPLCDKHARTLQRICVPYQDQVAEIYLLGTAHVSNDSSRDVQLLLETLHPDVIFVELCDQRTSMLEEPDYSICQNKTKPFWEKVTDVQLQNNNSRIQSMATVLLTQTQEEYADSLGVELGGEFRVAYRYWRSFPVTATATASTSTAIRQRPHLILGDRPLAITLARAWESLGWWGKCKVLLGLLLSAFHKPKPEELRKWIQGILEDEETDLLSSSLEDLRKHFPSLERVIIRERDAYMACKLYQLCRGLLVSAARTSSSSSSSPTTTRDGGLQQQQRKPIVIAAVVGAGHVPGICEWLTTKTHPQGPEDLLATLIATKKFAHEDLSPLIYDVTELQDHHA